MCFGRVLRRSLDLKTAKQNNSKIITLDLPFAYGWNYGGHLKRGCTEAKCYENVSVNFNNATTSDAPTTSNRFDVLTGTELGLSPSTIRQVFPNPELFLDVVHLSNQGHATVAEQLLPILQKAL